MNMKPSLPKTQQELLDAMKGGVACRFMAGLDAYYFRNDTMKRCTAPAMRLLERGLVGKVDEDWRGHTLKAL